MAIHRIHVNQHIIRSNRASGKAEPVLTVKGGGANRYASRVDVLGEDGKVVCTVVYRPENPLSCGAEVWIETTGNIVLDGAADAPTEQETAE